MTIIYLHNIIVLLYLQSNKKNLTDPYLLNGNVPFK